MNRIFSITNQSDISYIILKMSLLLVFLNSLHAWFMWGAHVIIVHMICIMAFLIFYLKNAGAFEFSERNILICILFMIVRLYIEKGSNINGVIQGVSCSILISFLLCVRDKLKIEILHFLCKVFALMVFISLLGWGLFLTGVSLPSTATDFLEGQYRFNNYYLFLHLITYRSYAIPRFSAVFLEPGHLGMIVVFFLFIYRLNLKMKEIWVLLVALFFTFSLAAYILLIISFVALAIINTQKPLLKFFLSVLLLFTAYLFFSNYNNGDNVVNEFIIQRLEFMEGKMAGDNRVTDKLEFQYERIIKTNSRYFGLGAEYYKYDWGVGGNAGYKRFIVQHGIIGVLLLFVFYLSLTLKYKSKYAFVLLLIYIIAFLQRSYLLWEIFLIVYITSLPLLKETSEKMFALSDNHVYLHHKACKGKLFKGHKSHIT